MLVLLINIVTLVVLISVGLSWFPAARENAAARTILEMTDPLFEKIRSVIPPAGGLDLSPMIVLLALQLLKAVLH